METEITINKNFPFEMAYEKYVARLTKKMQERKRIVLITYLNTTEKQQNKQTVQISIVNLTE